MPRQKGILVAVVGLLAVPACASTPRTDPATPVTPCGATDVADVRRAIDSTLAHADERLRRGDSQSLWDLYADDALFMWDNQKTWRGKQEAQREAAKVLGDLLFTDHKQTTEDLLVCGDLAVQAGTFEHTLRTKDGSEVKSSGKNLIVWKRQANGGWRIVRNLGNDSPREQR